jgi:hypothetical protein
MSNYKKLENLYQEYLQSNLDRQVTIDLCHILNDCGLTYEAQGLECYLKNGSDSICIFQEGLWKNRQCFVGGKKPSQATPGNLWLDTTELTLSVFVPNRLDRSPDTAGWVSTHPVYVWQFRTFLSLVEIGKKIDVFPHASDYLMLERFQSMGSMDFIVNLYHDEALAYAAWFQKGIVDDSLLKSARDFLNSTEFSAVIPSELKLWVGAEYSEWLRIAVGRSSIDKHPYEDELKFEEFNGDLELLESLPDRILYQEWDKRDYIGLSTSDVAFELPEISGNREIQTTLHFQILSTAPRR